MLQHRVIPSTRPWGSIRFASQLSRNPIEGRRPLEAMANTSANAESARKSSSILSRSSERARSRLRRSSGTEQNSPTARVEVAATANGTPRPRAISFISARSAQKRDHAAEKWFIDVRELDISNVDQPNDLTLAQRKKRRFEYPKKHEMRPKTDLNTLFAPTVRSATSVRVQTKKELGGDYTSYLPDKYADPYRLPIAYARLVLGRNKYIPLSAQTIALDIVEETIKGKRTRQDK